MPEAFGSWTDEADACRRHAAVFDFSCLVSCRVAGPDAAQLLEAFCGRRLSDMDCGAIRYALTVDEDGRLCSDLTVWRCSAEDFLVVSGRPEDLTSLQANLWRRPGRSAVQVHITDATSETCVLAIQGPSTPAVLARLTGEALPGRFRFARIDVDGADCLVARMGYTGYDGVEILCAPELAERLWNDAVRELQAAGLRAANLLRLEANLVLFTHDFAPGVTAAEAGLGRFRPGSVASGIPLKRVRAKGLSALQLDNLAFAPARTRPRPGEFAVTSWSSLDGSRRSLLMGYVVSDASCENLRDPEGIFSDIDLV